MVHTPVDINEVKQLAATGHFRSIALWLNYPLVPQSIYARVQTDKFPGYLQILLEFERPPKQDALIRLVCNRICRLESGVIRGVYVVGRLVGTDQPLWQQRVKLRQQKSFPQESPKTPVEQPKPPEAVATSPVEILTATNYGGETLKAVPSYLIPKESHPQERRRRPNRSNTPSPLVHIRPADIDSDQTAAQRREIRRRFAPKEIIEQQFKYMRAIVVTGSAAAAFILGCMTETVMSQRGEVTKKSEPTLPTFKNDGWRPLNNVEAQEIAYRSSMRGSSVSAALEPVAVMSHEPNSDPENPTVTLMFGGEVPVGEVPLQTPEAVGQVLGDLDMFRKADVAMVGLGNSLAAADTSLQESYFDRSRPEAVDALRQGGIDIVGLTGVQTMDYGHQGLTETLKTLDSAGIYRVGAGRDQQEARRPEVLEVKGQRIAYLSYAPDSDDAATLGKAGLNIQERDSIIEDIAALREAVDWIVVNYRWYGDLDIEPNTQQVNLSRSAIDAGADLVVGYHPDQIQGAELYKSRPIVYSLGDFVFHDTPLADHDTAALRVSLRNKQMKVEFLPIRIKEARPRPASGETAKTILKQIRQASDALPFPLQFPTILEVAPQKSPLLKPDKPVAPIKTLGELEPGTPVSPVDTSGDMTPELDIFEPEPFEWGTFELENEDINDLNGSEADGFNGFEADGFESNGFAPNTPDADLEGGYDVIAPPVYEPIDSVPKRNELPTNPLDTFNTQPDEYEVNLSAPDDLDQVAEPIQSTPLPKVDTVPQTLPDATFIDDGADDGIDASGIDDLVPEQRDDTLIPAEKTLPGYDVLENWGEKSSPHKEFNPIQEHLDSLEPNGSAHSDSLLPAVSVDADNDSHAEKSTATEAISPHHEPLVGPLSQHLPDFLPQADNSAPS
ncbi:CapA family protein [Leptothoe spongobia]|uniref:CapA family protein n=1 Tax=Leptothoe spongobia TAU-MAC 1115 TaxID=1967444 RepID=A0A947DH47_9CYAN|nr:CapA family protein [Leptothoe spongobia]MBT9316967.1 CapA family protein [Leptothoe spongobia TAU-MAC 1115]